MDTPWISRECQWIIHVYPVIIQGYQGFRPQMTRHSSLDDRSQTKLDEFGVRISASFEISDVGSCILRGTWDYEGSVWRQLRFPGTNVKVVCVEVTFQEILKS